MDAVIPTQGTIAMLGNLGAKRRVVTIYGSPFGPRYSIGCQIGVDIITIRERVADNTNTNATSAGTYVPYLGIMQEIGGVVQRAFDAEHVLLAELNTQRAQLGI